MKELVSNVRAGDTLVGPWERSVLLVVTAHVDAELETFRFEVLNLWRGGRSETITFHGAPARSAWELVRSGGQRDADR